METSRLQDLANTACTMVEEPLDIEILAINQVGKDKQSRNYRRMKQCQNKEKQRKTSNVQPDDET